MVVQASNDEERQKHQLDISRKKEAEDLARIMSNRYKLPYINLHTVTIDLDSLKIIPEERAREGHLIVFQSTGKKLSIGIINPARQTTKQTLEELKNRRFVLDLFIISENSLERALAQYAEIPKFEQFEAGIIKISPQRIEEFAKNAGRIDVFAQKLTETSAAKEMRKISEIVEMLIAGALQFEASDIHIEPQEDRMRLRFRIDGVLTDIVQFTLPVYNLLLSRIKLVSELKLNIRDKPQDGRFTVRADNLDVEVRTSVLPGPNGESVVLRVLHPKTISLTLEDLGLHPEAQKVIEREIKKPNGMLLTTGPTGSGKTTTLYAFIKKVNEPGIKIITIEDPIEYHIEGITQTQTEPARGYDFASGLRSILRQDPDTVLIGEIRDLDTAQTALHAALTGHMVFSTLHTNNAAGTIPRLIDLGAKPNIIAPALNATMAQRLVRRLCQKCKKEYSIEKDEYEKISSVIKKIPEKYKGDVRIGQKTKAFKKVGCPACNDTGFKGRVGVFEVFVINEDIEQLILKGTATEKEFQRAAENQGMLTMYQDGILKVLKGITSILELERLVSPEI